MSTSTSMKRLETPPRDGDVFPRPTSVDRRPRRGPRSTLAGDVEAGPTSTTKREAYERDVALARAGNREAIERLAAAARPRGGRPALANELPRAEALREELGSWEAAARELGVSRKTIDGWRKARR